MSTQGLQILVKENRSVGIELPDILKVIADGNLFFWSILSFEGSGQLDGKSILILEKEINQSSNGLFLEWEELKKLAQKFSQIIDMVLIGCKDKNRLRRYDNNQEMFEMCDFAIIMFDGWFWIIFSKYKQMIDELKLKYIKTKSLSSDFKSFN